MRLYDEEVLRRLAAHRPTTGGPGLVTLDICFPTDTDGLRIAYPCPHCGAGVLAEKDEEGKVELRCSLCGREVCRTCGREMLAGWCESCQGEPVVLQSKRQQGNHAGRRR